MAKKYSLFIGRWQPFHEGHMTLINKVLDEGKNVLIACRLADQDEKNPYSYEDREKMIKKHHPDDDRVKVIPIDDIEEVCYGRDVGWGIRELRLDEQIEHISATKIRADMKAKDKIVLAKK